MNIQRLRELMAPYRRETLVYFPATFQLDDVLVYPYPVAGTTDPCVGPVAAMCISHLSTITRLISLLGQEHREQHKRLSACLLQLQVVLKTVIEKRQAHPICNTLLVLLEAFESLVYYTRQHVHDRLLRNLRALMARDHLCAAAFISVEDVDGVVLLVDHVNDEYQRFYHELETVLYSGQELAATRDDGLQLQEALAGLLMLVESSTLLETSLLAGLQNWKKWLTDQEVQLLLN